MEARGWWLGSSRELSWGVCEYGIWIWNRSSPGQGYGMIDHHDGRGFRLTEPRGPPSRGFRLPEPRDPPPRLSDDILVTSRRLFDDFPMVRPRRDAESENNLRMVLIPPALWASGGLELSKPTIN